ncbi:tetratricopeptide repeat protein [Sansalvadorimonas verongulae]|uniref:tetratricopeptide repeat protein n=1 Tax=Sansalvadorimonas verongulae TaxID=2172824 RepID=UPI0018AD178C|nr:tetratricopeptide repeat protein [Sansalvadorimonas verongulae]
MTGFNKGSTRPLFLKIFRLCGVAAAGAVLTGCAGMKLPGSLQTNSSKQLAPKTEQSVTAEESRAEVPVLPPASFEPDTVYDLLVAEMAAYGQRYDLTLGNYLQQAHKTEDPGLAERAYQVATYLNARQAARDAAQLWIKVDPDNPAAIRAQAVEQIWDNKLILAVAGLEKVQAAGQEAPFMFLAIQAGGADDETREQLLSEYERLLKIFPGTATLQIGQAMLLHQQEHPNKALSLVNKTIREHGEDPASLLLKGRLLSDLDRLDESIAMLSVAVKKFPNAPRIRLLYGRQLVKKGDLTGAQRQFEVLVEQQPRNPELLLSVALVAMENGMPGEAGLYFHRLSKIPDRANIANFYLGRLAEQMDDWREGRESYLKVTPGKQFIPAYSSLVRMLSDHDQWGMAQQDLANARKKYPDYAPQFYMMEGEVLLEQQGYDAAAKVYDKALEEFPDSINLLYSRAMLAEKLDDLARLEVELNRILKMDPDNAAALNALGYTLADRTDRIQDAQKLVARAYKLKPDDPSIIDSMGWVEYRLGNYQEALGYLRQAYELFNDAEVAAHLGEVLWMMGEHHEATSIWEEALERQPNSEVLKATIERLKSSSKDITE